MRRICGVFVGLGVLLGAVSAPAQTLVYNPTTVEFAASPDHTVTLPDSQPLVASYEFRVYAAGAAAPTSRVTLGKPTPDATGKCSVGVSSTILALPLSATTQYVARIAAIGPTGEGESANSNPFGHVGAPAPSPSVVLRK